MKSPKEARPKSTPKKVTLEGGIKMSVPMAGSRVTPEKKTQPKLYNDCCR